MIDSRNNALVKVYKWKKVKVGTQGQGWVDLWLDKLQQSKKMCPPWWQLCVPGEESTNLEELNFLDRTFPFLDLRSEGLSNLATLSEPRFARSDNRSALLDISPSSLRSRKGKVLSRKNKFFLVCIPLLYTRLSPSRNIYFSDLNLFVVKVKPISYTIIISGRPQMAVVHKTGLCTK